jgi:hypothetical protein
MFRRVALFPSSGEVKEVPTSIESLSVLTSNQFKRFLPLQSSGDIVHV